MTNLDVRSRPHSLYKVKYSNSKFKMWVQH